MIRVSKNAWVNKDHIVKVKQCEGCVKIHLCDGTLEVLDVNMLSLETLIQMLEGSRA